jgi:hypothetical protein
MEMNIKNIAIIGVIAFAAIWAGNKLLAKLNAADMGA